MLSKNYLLVVSAFAAASIMLTASCKKSDEISAMSPVSSGATQMTSPAGVVESYTIVAKDGHTIGFNGERVETITKQSVNSVNSCGETSNLVINAVSDVALSGGRMGCVLSNSWSTGGGQCIALYINGQPYKDGNSGYGLWSSSTNAIAAEYTQIAGGIVAGKIFNNFIRTYCNADTTGSSYFDSPVSTYKVPEGYECVSVIGSPIRKGHKK